MLDINVHDFGSRVYYLPRIPEDWTALDISFRSVKEMTRRSRVGKFFIPLITIGSLVLIDLKTIDDAIHQKTTSGAENPHNVRFLYVRILLISGLLLGDTCAFL